MGWFTDMLGIGDAQGRPPQDPEKLRKLAEARAAYERPDQSFSMRKRIREKAAAFAQKYGLDEDPETWRSDDLPEVQPMAEERAVGRGTDAELYDVSHMESLGRGALQGATLGFSDEMIGGVEALARKIGGDSRSIGDLYDLARDEGRAANRDAQLAHGSYYDTGELAAGTALSAIPMAGGARAAQGAKALTMGQRATQGAIHGAKTAAPAGAVAGAGYSEADTPGGVALDTAVGGGAGLLLGPVAGAAGGAASGLRAGLGRKVTEAVTSGDTPKARAYAAAEAAGLEPTMRRGYSGRTPQMEKDLQASMDLRKQGLAKSPSDLATERAANPMAEALNAENKALHEQFQAREAAAYRANQGKVSMGGAVDHIRNMLQSYAADGDEIPLAATTKLRKLLTGLLRVDPIEPTVAPSTVAGRRGAATVAAQRPRVGPGYDDTALATPGPSPAAGGGGTRVDVDPMRTGNRVQAGPGEPTREGFRPFQTVPDPEMERRAARYEDPRLFPEDDTVVDLTEELDPAMGYEPTVANQTAAGYRPGPPKPPSTLPDLKVVVDKFLSDFESQNDWQARERPAQYSAAELNTLIRALDDAAKMGSDVGANEARALGEIRRVVAKIREQHFPELHKIAADEKTAITRLQAQRAAAGINPNQRLDVDPMGPEGQAMQQAARDYRFSGDTAKQQAMWELAQKHPQLRTALDQATAQEARTKLVEGGAAQLRGVYHPGSFTPTSLFWNVGDFAAPRLMSMRNASPTGPVPAAAAQYAADRLTRDQEEPEPPLDILRPWIRPPITAAR